MTFQHYLHCFLFTLCCMGVGSGLFASIGAVVNLADGDRDTAWRCAIFALVGALCASAICAGLRP